MPRRLEPARSARSGWGEARMGFPPGQAAGARRVGEVTGVADGPCALAGRAGGAGAVGVETGAGGAPGGVGVLCAEAWPIGGRVWAGAVGVIGRLGACGMARIGAAIAGA